jgi:stage II sporulation protein D
MLKQPPSKPATHTASEPVSESISVSTQANPSSPVAPSAKAPSAKAPSAKAPQPLLSKVLLPKKLVKDLTLKNLAALPAGKILLALGLLGATTGLAFTQVAPTTLQAALLPEHAMPEAPLRRVGDPAAETLISTRNLFLTNQLFYSKIEAIAGVARKPAASAQNAQTNGGTAPAATGTNATPGSSQNTAQVAESVTAAAPPAPKIAAAPLTGPTIDTVLEMRVAVAKDVEAIALTTSGGGVITDLDGNGLKSLSAETTVLAEIGDGIVVDGAALPTAFWVYPEDGGFVAVGESWYRGRVLVALRDRGLIAVNHVLLGDYLYSVVGSEMSASWSIEALKAQAVAARSYALTHNIRPASADYFDLDNTPRFQAYTGIAREADTTQAAVQATAGEFISHDGGIVESLYAASQAIVDDAHKGSGMSQMGAKDLADQGYDYTEILGYYYPGTALGRLEADAE